jgi:alpha-mannosidase
MAVQEVLVLIPSHSLEDFPTELSEDDASSLINCFSVAWHPALLKATGRLPKWHRADCPPEDDLGRYLALVPTGCESWLATGWADRVVAAGGIIIRGLSERQSLIAEIERLFPPGDALAAELTADFLALGHVGLQLELLTRKMRHFSSMDEVYLQREAVAAAEAALAGDAETTQTRLTQCFETLLEQRHRFYAVESWMLDLCLLTVAEDLGPLEQALLNPKGLSLLTNAADLREVVSRSPAVAASLREGAERGELEVVCGATREVLLGERPVNSILWQLQAARQAVQEATGQPAFTWGVRRYAVDPVLPQLLKKSGYDGALHFVLDDGVYPDYEHAKFRWEGIDGTPIDAISRIPLSAESPVSYLKLADRLSESMDNDQSAAVIFARWPGVKSPFFDDLRRCANFAPVLGKLVTFREFFERTDFATRSGNYKPREYLSPAFWQSVAREEKDPLSRPATHSRLRSQLDAASTLRTLTDCLYARTVSIQFHDLERELEDVADRPTSVTISELSANIATAAKTAARDLARLIAHGGKEPGYLVLNPMASRRVLGVELDGPRPLLPEADVQTIGTKHRVVCDVPALGFAWIPAVTPGQPSPPAKPATKSEKAVPLAETNLLRNDFFEVMLHPERGGIASLRTYGRSPNLLSEQVSFRFPKQRTWHVGEGEDRREIRSHYAEPRATGSELLESGPVSGCVRTTGEIVDPAADRVLARFTQTFRVWRHRPYLEMTVELETVKSPDLEAWHSYYGLRFAYGSTAALSRSAHGAPFESTDERIESPEFLELATLDHRVTILPGGLPYARLHEAGQIDVILIAGAETRRRFDLVIAIDEPHPYRAARTAFEPVFVVPEVSGPPRGGATGWLLHSSSKSVEVLSLGPLVAEPPSVAERWMRSATPANSAEPTPVPNGLSIRLMETEGRVTRTDLDFFRPPVRARVRDFTGKTILEIAPEKGRIPVRLGAFEIVDVELYF